MEGECSYVNDEDIPLRLSLGVGGGEIPSCKLTYCAQLRLKFERGVWI